MPTTDLDPCGYCLEHIAAASPLATTCRQCGVRYCGPDCREDHEAEEHNGATIRRPTSTTTDPDEVHDAVTGERTPYPRRGR